MKRYYLQTVGEEPLDISSMGTFSVGREGDIQVDDLHMSRIHFLISLPTTEQSFVIVIDGNGTIPSKNGTVVNGIRLSLSAENELDKAASLKHGDIISAGRTNFKFLVFEAEHKDVLSHKETLS